MLIHVTLFVTVKIVVNKKWIGKLFVLSRACTNTVIRR